MLGHVHMSQSFLQLPSTKARVRPGFGAVAFLARSAASESDAASWKSGQDSRLALRRGGGSESGGSGGRHFCNVFSSCELTCHLD